MKHKCCAALPKHLICTGVLALACITLHAQAAAVSLPGLPEPGLIMYGRVVDRVSGLPVQSGSVTFQITGSANGEVITVAAAPININGQAFYVAQALFETRSIGAQTFTKTANTLSLTPGNSSYTRTAFCDGKLADFKTPGIGQFVFGAATRGRVDRVDLLVGGKPTTDPNQDSDGDGVPDWQELIAGTDPNDPQSVFKASTDLHPTLGGGLVIKWSSVAGKTYSVFRSKSLSQPFDVLASGIPATPPQNQFTDPALTGTSSLFYRIVVQ